MARNRLPRGAPRTKEAPLSSQCLDDRIGIRHFETSSKHSMYDYNPTVADLFASPSGAETVAETVGRFSFVLTGYST